MAARAYSVSWLDEIQIRLRFLSRKVFRDYFYLTRAGNATCRSKIPREKSQESHMKLLDRKFGVSIILAVLSHIPILLLDTNLFFDASTDIEEAISANADEKTRDETVMEILAIQTSSTEGRHYEEAGTQEKGEIPKNQEEGISKQNDINSKALSQDVVSSRQSETKTSAVSSIQDENLVLSENKSRDIQAVDPSESVPLDSPNIEESEFSENSSSNLEDKLKDKSQYNFEHIDLSQSDFNETFRKETSRMNPDTSLPPIELPYLLDECLPDAPLIGKVAVIIEPDGQFLMPPGISRGTGYSVIDEQALLHLESYDFPSRDETTAYSFDIYVDYPLDDCP